MVVLVVLPVPAALQVYRILLRYTSLVQPLSCDEAFMDLTGAAAEPAAVVEQIRAEIQDTTGCTASAGEAVPGGWLYCTVLYCMVLY
jgi:nucleotidyltransferase/DNA polymerase involved in DNA repair